MGDKDAAKEQFELVLSGKPLEVNASGRKGKYSMEVRVLRSLTLSQMQGN